MLTLMGRPSGSSRLHKLQFHATMSFAEFAPAATFCHIWFPS